MKLSSLDIRKQDFTRVVRGYDKEEVDAFLQLVGNQWQELVDDLRREEEKTNELNGKLEHYQKVEEALEEALKTARDSAKQTISNAEEKARLIVEEAENKSLNITKDAESERLGIRKDAAKYSVRQKEIVAKLRAFLMSELEILAQYESEAPANYVKLIPAERGELVQDLSNLEQEIEAIREENVAKEPEEEMADQEEEAPAAEEILESTPGDAEEGVEHAVTEEVEVTEDLEEVAVAEVVEPSATSAGSKKKSSTSKSKDPEVSDEIEKIRRILEDLES